ncbi:MAG: prolyl aminopeptidase [Methylococcales bacterium]|nr:prolyl aminopeptidase [Methylococcales bacterium]
MKPLYPEITPYHTFFLETESQHAVYIEESGSSDGVPVLFLHGGPCSGTSPHHRCFFNPEKYRIILMDQRGSGLSTPYGELKNNTTDYLIKDMEALRLELKIEKWLLFGGSWGATLSLLYAQKYPENVSAMILRGVFLSRQKDMDWFVSTGVPNIYPEYWQHLMNVLPKTGDDTLVEKLYKTVTCDDELSQRRAAKAWMNWSGQVALGDAYQETHGAEHVTEKMLKQVRMELHYAIHNYFIDEGQVLDNCEALTELPCIIIHGRHDLMCPVEGAMSLHNVLPSAQYFVLPHSGHVAKGEEMIDALVSSTNTMAEILA